MAPTALLPTMTRTCSLNCAPLPCLVSCKNLINMKSFDIIQKQYYRIQTHTDGAIVHNARTTHQRATNDDTINIYLTKFQMYPGVKFKIYCYTSDFDL